MPQNKDMNSSGSASENLSKKNRIGPTIYWDITGLDGQQIGQIIHLVYRFHAKGAQICESEEIKDGNGT
jgi:hypothetical protein